MVNINDLPPEILCEIFSHVTYKDLLILTQVCTYWEELFLNYGVRKYENKILKDKILALHTPKLCINKQSIINNDLYLKNVYNNSINASSSYCFDGCINI